MTASMFTDLKDYLDFVGMKTFSFLRIEVILYVPFFMKLIRYYNKNGFVEYEQILKTEEVEKKLILSFSKNCSRLPNC